MAMANEKTILLDFLKNINEKNYAGAEQNLRLAMETKIKNRVRKAIGVGKKGGCSGCGK